MTTKTGPVIVNINVEASPSETTIEIDRAEWDTMTPAGRGALLDNMVQTELGNAGGAGWGIADQDDEAAVGTPLYGLAGALNDSFTETELHALMTFIETFEHRDASYLRKLRKAAIEAANCDDCKTTRR